MIEVDARGLSCPEPVLMTLDAIKKADGDTIKVLVSDTNQRDNVAKQAQRKGKEVAIEQQGQDYILTIS